MARDRPRRADREPARCSAGWPDRACRSGPVVKADAYGHGAVPIARALEAAGADGFCVAAIDEALELREGGVRAPDPGALPGARRVGRRRPRGSGIAVTAGDAGLLDELLAAAATARRRTRRSTSSSRSRPGWAAAGSPTTPWSTPRDASPRRPGCRLPGLWTHLQAVEDPGGTGVQVDRFEAVVGGDRRRRDRPAAAPRRRQRGAPDRRRRAAYDGVRPGLAIYGLVPDELARRRDLERDLGQPPPGHVARRPTGPRRRPAGGLGDQLRADLPDRAAEPDRDAAARLRRRLVARGCRTGRRRSSAAGGCPLVGNVAMDAVMADVTDVPGPAGRRGRRVRPARDVDGDERITVAELAQERTTNSWEVVTGMARRLPRVYHAAAGPVGLRTLTERSRLVARIELWNGDICDLEVDAIVNAANPSLWMSTGVGGALKRAGGDAIEFAAVRQAPGRARRRDRDAGRDARRQGGHPRRLARSRPADERRDDRGRGPQRDGPGPRDRRRRASPSRRSAPASAGSRSRRAPGSRSRPSATSCRRARPSRTSSSRFAVRPPTRPSARRSRTRPR